MSIFGKEYQERKNLPLFSFLTGYFPKALVEVVKVCVAGNVQHNKEAAPTDIFWARGKSTDQLNTALRHLFDHKISGPFDDEPEKVQEIIGGRTYHLAKAAWRILAELELQIERDQALAAPTWPGTTQVPSPESAGQSAEEVLLDCGCFKICKGHTMTRNPIPWRGLPGTGFDLD